MATADGQVGLDVGQRHVSRAGEARIDSEPRVGCARRSRRTPRRDCRSTTGACCAWQARGCASGFVDDNALADLEGCGVVAQANHDQARHQTRARTLASTASTSAAIFGLVATASTRKPQVCAVAAVVCPKHAINVWCGTAAATRRDGGRAAQHNHINVVEHAVSRTRPRPGLCGRRPARRRRRRASRRPSTSSSRPSAARGTSTRWPGFTNGCNASRAAAALKRSRTRALSRPTAWPSPPHTPRVRRSRVSPVPDACAAFWPGKTIQSKAWRCRSRRSDWSVASSQAGTMRDCRRFDHLQISGAQQTRQLGRLLPRTGVEDQWSRSRVHHRRCSPAPGCRSRAANRAASSSGSARRAERVGDTQRAVVARQAAQQVELPVGARRGQRADRQATAALEIGPSVAVRRAPRRDVAGSCSGSTSSASSRSPARAWIAQSALAGRRWQQLRIEHHDSAASSSSRFSPARASTMASYWPSSSLRRRVSTLPRMGTKCRSGRTARRNAARRALLVPTRAPAASSSSPRPSARHQHVERVVARRDGDQCQAACHDRRHVLQAVHGEVDLVAQQRRFELFDEHAGAPALDLAGRCPAIDRRWSRSAPPRPRARVRLAQGASDEVGLGARQRAGTCADADYASAHAAPCVRRRARRRARRARRWPAPRESPAPRSARRRG